MLVDDGMLPKIVIMYGGTGCTVNARTPEYLTVRSTTHS